MRIVIFVTWLCLLGLALPYALSAQVAKRPPRITVSATIEGARLFPAGQIRFYLVWNHQESARPIGHAYQSCVLSGNGGFLCTSVYSFPYGRITATGEARGFAKFSSVITGGSQSRVAKRVGHSGYAGAEGTVVSRRVGPGTFRFVFLLEP